MGIAGQSPPRLQDGAANHCAVFIFITIHRAFGLGALGSIGLAHRDTDLDVLVTPFSGVTNLIRAVPIIGPVSGETLTGIPIAVKGDIRDPQIVPLDPAAVASDLTALVRRALNVPEMVLRSSRSAPAPDQPRE